MNWTLRAPSRSSLVQVTKSAVATLVAWLVAAWLIGGPPPVFAAIAALLIVQPSISQSFARGLERTVGVIAGVVVASLLGIVLGTGFPAIALAVVSALLLSWALRTTAGTANQVAISALLVLALGTGTPDYAVDRILETALGALIGLIVNVVFVPPVALAPARSRVGALAHDAADALDRLGAALVRRQSPQELAALLESARAVRAGITSAESALDAARESLALNPRGRTLAADVDALETEVRRLFAIVTQLIGMTRAFVEDYDDTVCDEADARAISEQLHRAAHDLRLPAGARAHDVAPEPAALTRPLDVATPPAHWVLIGSLLVDLRRIHHGIAETSG